MYIILPLSSALLLTRPGLAVSSSLMLCTIPLTGVITSDAAFTLSTAPTVSINISRFTRSRYMSFEIVEELQFLKMQFLRKHTNLLFWYEISIDITENKLQIKFIKNEKKINLMNLKATSKHYNSLYRHDHRNELWVIFEKIKNKF